MTEHDPVNHPSHYTAHPSGVECIEITEHMGFCLGNAVKYIWRAGMKYTTAEGETEDLKKAVWYLEREIERLEKMGAHHPTQVRVSGVPYPVDSKGRYYYPRLEPDDKAAASVPEK